VDLPDAFKKQMEAQLGKDQDAFFQALQSPSPVSIRFNPKKFQPKGNNKVPWCLAGRYLEDRPSFTLDPLFQAGAYYVQEASSMLLEQAVTQSIDITAPTVALDLCAAPGGKSTHLLGLMSSESLVISNEAIRGRAAGLIENIEKWGYPNSIITQNDPADFSRLEGFADLILVDAPCSGEGLFRKDPLAIREWSPLNVERCAARQRRILADVWNTLRPGGALIYSTCTYNTKENHENLRWVAENNDCTFLPLRLDPIWGIDEVISDNYSGYQCFPHHLRGEGFFISVMKKAGQAACQVPRSKDRLLYPSNSTSAELNTWITNPENTFHFLHGSVVRMLPRRYKPHLLVLLESARVIQAGTAMGELKKNKIVPDHAIALSIFRNRKQLAGIALSKDQALNYLRMDRLQLPEWPVGYHVVEYEGLGLGWVNLLPGRINNLFPSSRRIRLGN